MIANKMLFLFVLISTALAQQKRDLIACDGVIFHSVYFDKELLFNNLGRPYNLVFHKYSGLLFFSHTIRNGTHIDFSIMSCHVRKRQCTDIGVSGGYAVAYDKGNDDIYFGGHNGIYKYNFVSNKAEFFAEEGKSIWGLFVKRNFYYIEYPSQKLYVYQDDIFVKVTEGRNIEIDNFFISKYNHIYYSNKTALYKIERGSWKAMMYNDDVSIRQIVEDSYGDVFFVGNDGIYIEDRPYHRIKRVAQIDEAYGMAFDDHEHVIYSDKLAVYRLLPSRYSELCYNATVKEDNTEFDYKVMEVKYKYRRRD